MTIIESLTTYICQFCNKSYQSDGNRKPRTFKKDGTIHQYYDSKILCSRECCLKRSQERHKQTLKNTPEIMKDLHEKRKRTYLNNPEIKKRQTEKLKQTLKEHPEIVKKSREKFKQKLKNNSGIRKRISRTLKQTYKNNSEIKKRQTEKLKQTLKEHPEIVERQTEKHKQTLKNNPEIMKIQVEKAIFTKRKNNTFNASQPEDQLYLLLKSKYSDTIRQYKDSSRYPFCCDFYIPSLDLFVELQLSWTHGGKPFNENDVECQNKLNIWKQKSLKSKFYKNAIETWTARDVKKRDIASANKLNYIEVFSSDFKELYAAGFL